MNSDRLNRNVCLSDRLNRNVCLYVCVHVYIHTYIYIQKRAKTHDGLLLNQREQKHFSNPDLE